MNKALMDQLESINPMNLSDSVSTKTLLNTLESLEMTYHSLGQMNDFNSFPTFNWLCNKAIPQRDLRVFERFRVERDLPQMTSSVVTWLNYEVDICLSTDIYSSKKQHVNAVIAKSADAALDSSSESEPVIEESRESIHFAAFVNFATAASVPGNDDVGDLDFTSAEQEYLESEDEPDVMAWITNFAQQNGFKGGASKPFVPFRKPGGQGRPNGVFTPKKSAKVRNCDLCHADHPYVKCEKFLALDQTARLKHLIQVKRCTNCFFKGHIAKECDSKYSCFECGKKHNRKLHDVMTQRS
jgi:hypothetical protein